MILIVMLCAYQFIAFVMYDIRSCSLCFDSTGRIGQSFWAQISWCFVVMRWSVVAAWFINHPTGDSWDNQRDNLDIVEHINTEPFPVIAKGIVGSQGDS